MLEGLRQAGERGQIQDFKGVNFFILNVPYRLLSGSEGPGLTIPSLTRCFWGHIYPRDEMKNPFPRSREKGMKGQTRAGKGISEPGP
jgi:hypothetical protein